jgi:hypothetical protein
VDTASSQPGDLLLPLPSAQESSQVSPPASFASGLSLSLVEELSQAAEAESCGLTLEEFGVALASVGEKFNYGFQPDIHPILHRRLPSSGRFDSQSWRWLRPALSAARLRGNVSSASTALR